MRMRMIDVCVKLRDQLEHQTFSQMDRYFGPKLWGKMINNTEGVRRTHIGINIWVDHFFHDF